MEAEGLGDFLFWGHKTVSFFDVWSIEHVVMGVSITALCIKAADYILAKFYPMASSSNLRTLVSVLFLLLLAFYWEAVEHYLEIGLAGEAVAHWFAGVEHWSNRLISDILVVLVGCWLYLKFNWLEWPARIFSVVWLFVHIFIWQDSMYLHTSGLL